MRRLLFILFCVLPLAGAPLRAAEVALPDMGESSRTALSQQEADRIGHQIVQRMRRQGRLLEDPQVTAYVRDLGRRLASFSDRPGGDFHFFVVKDRTVNAFALPGGYIGVHVGLILTTESEGELAGVLAHEIAHITQR
ncbi:MAG TPA: M48 family metalloprotease, partial [Gammaproteobacteria bacterium]|nr:M48 family metalloprotease [Gammaproteobacteria bacterium]